jgi:hypothetical protein
MRTTSAEFIRGSARYLCQVDREGAATVSLLDWEGATTLLSGRWDALDGRILDWQPDLLSPHGLATQPLVDAAVATLRIAYDWRPRPVSAARE